MLRDVALPPVSRRLIARKLSWLRSIQIRFLRNWRGRDIFPLRSRPGGVLERRGQTEAAVDLARLAGLHPSGVICEIMNEDGSMARLPQLLRFCVEHDLKMITVEDLALYRLEREAIELWTGLEW